MNLENTNRNLLQIKIPEKDKQAILNLIDLKIENDMKEVINKIDTQYQYTNSQYQNQVDIQNQKFDFFNQKIESLKWTIIIVGSAIGIILSIIALK